MNLLLAVTTHLCAQRVDPFEAVHHELLHPTPYPFLIEVRTFFQKTRAHAGQGLLGPRLKPINSRARYKGGELAGPAPKLWRHRREAQDDV